MTDRLAEYFVVVGFEQQKQRGGSQGKVIQGFPEKEWKESPFTESISMFCQPQNWRLSTQQQQPTFFMFVLTDEQAIQHYCACFVFHEPIAVHPIKHDDEDVDDESLSSIDLTYPNILGTSIVKGNYHLGSKNIAIHQMMYAPKCLLLISRHNYPEILKNCLTVIYTVYIDNIDVEIECLITNLLASVEVPPPGSAPIYFTLGANDRQLLQPPLSSTIPVTSTSVYNLFNQLGISAAVDVVIALMTENKVLVLSRSYTQIYNACHALISLIYPFVYSHVFIPILPSSLLDFIASPTPFLMGIHSSLKSQATDTIDVIIVDLDEGSVKIPDGLLITKFDENLHAQLINQLCLVLRPNLFQADNAFQTSQFKKSPPQILDKEIRAIFLRVFTQLLQGYRSCLTVSRIYSKPIITFNKTSFLSQRNYINNEFVIRLLDCIYFSTFVQDRGIPYRPCDLFDELYSSLHNSIKEEIKNPDLILTHVRELGHQIFLNENPNINFTNSNVQIKIPTPTENAFTRVHLPPFPLLNAGHINELLENERIKRELHPINNRNEIIKNPQIPRIVPMGLPIPLYNEMIGIQNISTNSARRLEVMRKCINSIFEKKIHDARKTLNAVLRALRTKHARLALCEELNNHVMGNKAILEHEQFDLVVRLMNCALQDNSEIDINEVAAYIVPLAMKFCRRLSTNVIQFAYTCIQDHPIWSNLQFWEQTFYLDVEKDIKNLYRNKNEKNLKKLDVDISKQFSDFILEDSALEIAAQQMRIFDKLEQSTIEEYSQQENATIYAQAVHYANIIVAFKIPFDISDRNNTLNTSKHSNDDVDTNSISNFTNPSNPFDEPIINDNESGFEEDSNTSPHNHTSSEITNNAIKFINRFVDKVCNDSGISDESIKQLHGLIPSLVSIQVESLEPVWRESRHLPPLPKPKILFPHTLPGEEFTTNELRAYLINDGKDESRTGFIAGTQFIPAEGAIFLTNYRVIFKGRPLDAFASESIIMRSFPISTIVKEKRININPIPSLDQYLPEGLQLKSNTFQIIKIAFDEEVTNDKIETFRKILNRERCPPTIFHHFTFTSQLGVLHTKQLFQRKSKEKKGIQGMAKRTLMRTAEKAGFKTKNVKPKNKQLQNVNYFTMYNSSVPSSPKYFPDEKIGDSETISSSIDNLTVHSTASFNVSSNDSKSFHRLHEMLYVKDYERLGFGNYSQLYLVSVTGGKLPKMQSGVLSEHFRITSVNMHYSVCPTYPGMIVVPNRIIDENIKKLARCYRQGRFPAIVWKHPRTRALILRSSASHNKGMIGLFKTQAGNSNLSNANTSQIFSGANLNYETQVEHENFLRTISRLTMSNSRCSGYMQRISDIENSSVNSNSPDSYRKLLPPLNVNVSSKSSNNTFNRAMNTFRTSGGKSTIGHTMGRQLQKWSNSAMGKPDQRKSSISSINNANNKRPTIAEPNELNVINSPNSSISSTSLNTQISPLYIIGEKSHMKFMKVNEYYEFFPIEIHDVRQVKSSFKKLIKISVPSECKTSETLFNNTFLKDFYNTEWLKQVQTIMEIANIIVDFVDLRKSSVILSLEDGADLVPQIISVAELCLDPYYRTFEGFRALIEKEWLAFGHRFTHRSNLTQSDMSSGFAPLFLQFLDIVHQIHSQFPLSFEFNQYFIKFMAYHYLSCRFRTFLLDCERDRSECGWIEDDIKINVTLKKLMTEDDDDNDDVNEETFDNDTAIPSMINSSSIKTNSNSNKNSVADSINFTGTSFWDYCTKIWVKSPIFYNFYYVPIISIEECFTDAAVLRPLHNLPSLKIWDYYAGEELAHGPSYDLEVMNMERHRQEEMEIHNDNEKSGTHRFIVNSIYDSVDHVLPNCFIQLLDQIKLLEGELMCTSQKWLKIWNKIEIPINTDFESYTLQSKRLRSPPIKLSSLDALQPYQMGLINSNSFLKNRSFQPHVFEFFTSPSAKCDYCALLIGIKCGFKCSECDIVCHENCKECISKPCNRFKSRQINAMIINTNNSNNNSNVSNIPMSKNDVIASNPNPNVIKQLSETKSDSDSDLEPPVDIKNDITLPGRYQSQKRDNGTFKGYLFKKGALLKAWKQRYFVLDTTQHQLRYYDSEFDQSCKGYIDLSDVVSVTPTADPLVFELQLTKRIYNFMAIDEKVTHDWIERISACLQ